MRKTLIVTIDFPPILGGIASYLSGVARNLPKDKTIVLAPALDNSEEFDREEGYKIYRRNLVSKSFFLWPKWLPLIYHIFKIARKEKVEVILVGQVLPVGTAVFFLKKIFEIPYIISCHGMDILTAKKSFRKKRLMNKILEQSEKIISNSNFTKNELNKLGVQSKKIEILYPCVPKRINLKEDFLENVSRKYNLENKKIILTTGRLVKRKGHDKVIESLPKILEQFSDAKYIIVGDGPERENLENQVKNLNLGSHVIFTGKVGDLELAAFYQLCDLFITVSRQIEGDVEGFGTVYLEANLYGKPAIAGNSGGAGEAVIDGLNGLLVDPESIDEISKGIIKLLSDRDLTNQLGRQGKERVEKEFMWEVGIKKLKI